MSQASELYRFKNGPAFCKENMEDHQFYLLFPKRTKLKVELL